MVSGFPGEGGFGDREKSFLKHLTIAKHLVIVEMYQIKHRPIMTNEQKIAKYRQEAISYLKSIDSPEDGESAVRAAEALSRIITYIDNFPYREYRVK